MKGAAILMSAMAVLASDEVTHTDSDGGLLKRVGDISCTCSESPFVAE